MSKKKKQNRKKKIKKKHAAKSSGSSATVSYVCRSCKREEEIPEDNVRYFDLMDHGDPTVPPRFKCEFCGCEMWPKEDWVSLATRLHDL